MVKLIGTLILLVLPYLGCCQSSQILGAVKNFETHQPLAYVNIGISNKAVGTVSNEKGLFKLNLNEKITAKDTVIFSHIGFKTATYTVSDLSKQKKSILLQPEKTELDEVSLSTPKSKWRPKKIGRSSKGLGFMHTNFYSYAEKDVDDRLSKEKGMKFKIRKNCHLKDLNFNITSNDFKSLKFRVNIYSLENGIPAALIIQQNIIFEIKDQFSGWFKVDLEPYDLYFKEDIGEIAVTIQWLESVKTYTNSKYFSISTASSLTHTAYFRDKAMDSWRDAGQNLSFYLNASCK